MEHYLYLMEGLPSSGKSTSAKHVADILIAQGKHVVYIDEGTNKHPADYEFHSYLTGNDLENFSKQEKEHILSASQKRCGGFVVELSKLSDDLLPKVLPYKIYDFLNWETERPVMLDKWKDFVSNVKKDTIYIFNCCFLQNPMCETMMRFDFPFDESKQYIKELYEIIKPLNPALIYLKNDLVKDTVLTAAKERGGEWLNAVIDYHCNGRYGKTHALKGLNGYISCLQDRQEAEYKILNDLSIPCLMIENAHNDWDAAYSKMDSFLL